MTVHVVITKEVPVEKQQEWLKMAEEISVETWKEKGCISYSFIRNPDSATRFVIAEEWSNDDCLKAHFETEHFKRLVPLMDAISTTTNFDKCEDAISIQRSSARTRRNGRILILMDSSSDCTYRMGEFVAEGAGLLDRTDVRVRIVPGDVTNWDKHKDTESRRFNGYEFASLEDMMWADGVAAGTPTNLGCVSWRMKKFWDDISQLGFWNGADGKLGVSFSSQGGRGGGAELVCMAMNSIMMNCGFAVPGVTDYVSFKETMHYGACCAKAPREVYDQMACRRLGLRLAEFVGYYIIGRDETFPHNASKRLDIERWGPAGIPAREATVEELLAFNTRPFKPLPPTPQRVLIFTKMSDYVHGCTPATAAWVLNTVQEMGLQGVVSDDSSLLETSSAQEFALIVLVNNSGHIFDPKQEALTKHLDAGRGVVGIHAALATFLDGEDETGATALKATTPIIENVFKAHFKNHPPLQNATVKIDRAVAATMGGLGSLPNEFTHHDEFYNYSKNPCDDPAVQVVAYVDESTYEGGTMGDKHPLAWYHYIGEKKAPVFYCALGHNSNLFNGLGPHYVSTLVRAGLNFCKPK